MNSPRSAYRANLDVPLGDRPRTYLTLALLFHLFCLGLGILSVVRPARIVSDTLRLTAFYSQLTGLDMNVDYQSAPFYLTQGGELDADCFIDIEIPTQPGQTIDWSSAQRPTQQTLLPSPERNDRWSESFHRQRNLARYLCYFRDDETRVAPQVAQSVATRLLRDNKAESGRVAVRRHMTQPIFVYRMGTQEEQDPYHPLWYETDYAYHAIYDAFSDETILTREASKLQSAPVVPAGGTSK